MSDQHSFMTVNRASSSSLIVILVIIIIVVVVVMFVKHQRTDDADMCAACSGGDVSAGGGTVRSHTLRVGNDDPSPTAYGTVAISELYQNSTPPPNGTSAIATLRARGELQPLPTVASNPIGISDYGNGLATSAITGEMPPVHPVTAHVRTHASSLSTDYESMFDTQRRSAWSTTTDQRHGLPMDGPTIDLFTGGVPDASSTNLTITTPPRSTSSCSGCGDRAGAKSLWAITASDAPTFSSSTAGDQPNYLTSQNFWEYHHRYPVVPGDSTGPIAADVNAHADQQANPGVDYQIVGGNKDGGPPLPNGTYFRS